METIAPPTNLVELQNRANQLAGLNIDKLAKLIGISVPANLKITKGYIGQMVEVFLGADAGCKPEPDFTKLGVELKTIPVNIIGKALETTYICTAPIPPRELSWENSTVYKKLKHVLWVPYIADDTQSLKEYVFTNPILWQPNSEELETLVTDWEELTEMLCLGQFDNINSSYGDALHLRPKAANSRTLISVLDENNNMVNIVPKGFYLRTTFTNKILSSST